MRGVLLGLIGLVALFDVPTAAAEVTVTRVSLNEPGATKGVLQFLLSGTITDSDVARLSSALGKLQKLTTKPIVLDAKLDSSGGSVKAALALGKLMRSHTAIAQIEENSVCASACVFVLAGAVARIVVGKVMIHRPYDPNDQLTTPAEQKKKYGELKEEIGAFLEDVNVPLTLYDDMLRISPESAKILTEDDLDRYALSGSDPYHDEATDVSLAKKLGISRAEYARRKARANDVCDSMRLTEDINDPIWVEWAECHDRVMGIK